MSIYPSDISTPSLTGSTSDPSVDDITRLFRRLADRGDGAGGGPDGVVSDAEARTYARQAETAMGPHIKTTTDGTLTPHEQIGALEWEMRKIGGKDPARLARLQQAVSDLMCRMVDYSPVARPEDAPGRAVAQYGNIRFVSQNPSAAQAAQDYVRDFFKTASATFTGRFILESLIKQDTGQPITVRLNPETGAVADNKCTSHHDIQHYFNDHTIADPITILIHEMSHAAGFYWDGDITLAKTLCAVYPDMDTNANGTADCQELEAVIRRKRYQKFDPMTGANDDRRRPNITFDTFDNMANARMRQGYIGFSYSEHVATWIEQAFQLERGITPTRAIYDTPESLRIEPEPYERMPAQQSPFPRNNRPNNAPWDGGN